MKLLFNLIFKTLQMFFYLYNKFKINYRFSNKNEYFRDKKSNFKEILAK